MLATTEGERPIVIARDAWLLDLGRRPYRGVWDLQKALVDRRGGEKKPHGLILLENERGGTPRRRGKRGGGPDPRLGIVGGGRGGEGTDHRPGERLGYPIP